MILSTIIMFALSMSPVQSNSTGYKYTSQISYTQQCKSMYQKDNAGNNYLIDTDVTLTATNDFDDGESWRLSDFNIYVNSYYYKLNATGSSTTLQGQINYSISYDWVINPSQYYQQFDYIKFTIGVTDDDDFILNYYYDDVLEHTEYCFTISGSYDEVSLSINTITFNGASFFSSVEALMSNFHQDTETVVVVQPSTMSTASVIFQGIVNIGLMPVNFFLGILNFEVFDINIGAFVSALLTLAIVIIIVRIIFAGGNGKGKE